MSHFANNIKRLRTMNKLTGVEIEKALGLSGGSWSRYERSLATPSLHVAEKIADYFRVSLDELLGRNEDKSHITALRFKQAEGKLGPEEFEKAWLVGKKVWDLISTDDHAQRNENLQFINAIVNLLYEMRNGDGKKPLDVPSLFRIL